VGPFGRDQQVRRALFLLTPAVFFARLLPAQDRQDPPGIHEKPEDVRLPNGKRQQDEILKADYEKNLKDARELSDLARSLQEDLEKNDRFVLSVGTLKKTDDIEKLARKIRGRLKRF
jgi:hypothetical protein